MTGVFSVEIQQQIDGASSFPIGPTSTNPSPASSSPLSSTPPRTTGTSSSPRPSSTTGGSQNSGGALGLAAGKLLTGVVAAAVGLVMLL